MGNYAVKEGWRAINVWLSPEELAKLDDIRKAMDKTHYTEVMRRLLTDAKVEAYKR